MILAVEAMRCQCADVEMELVKEQRTTPFFGESWDSVGTIQTYCCPKCGLVAARALAPEPKAAHWQPPDHTGL